MTQANAGRCDRAATATYEIWVLGHLDDHWAGTLGTAGLVRLDDGTTSLTGPVIDQAHLHGVLARIRDLGVTLLALRTRDWARADWSTVSGGVGAEPSHPEP